MSTELVTPDTPHECKVTARDAAEARDCYGSYVSTGVHHECADCERRVLVSDDARKETKR